MTDTRRHSAHAVLADPTAGDQQRRGARCRLNRMLTILRALPPIPLMTCALEVDRIAEKRRRGA